MTTATPMKIINNPDFKTLREMARFEEIATSFGAPAYITRKAASRSAGFTRISDAVALGKSQQPISRSLLDKVQSLSASLLNRLDLIQMDRLIGDNTRKRWHCRLLIPREYARIALLWGQTLFDSNEQQKNPNTKPDFLTIDIPNWPEAFPGQSSDVVGPRGIFIAPESGHTWIFGTDYVGEVKMSFLRQAMYQMKLLGGLGLHAGSKAIKIKNSAGALHEAGILLLGLSGTGKTTLTLDDHALTAPEASELLQDDIVWLTQDATALGTEQNFYVKTEGVTEADQPAIFRSLHDPEAVFENVPVDSLTGLPQFDDYRHGTNGRALAVRTKIAGSSSRINLEKVHKIIFITRRDTIVPPVAKLSAQQTAAFFLLGESIETSAGDPARAGQPKHEAGFNPFIIGPETEEAKRLLEIVESNHIEGYLLNTGSIGKGGSRMGGVGKKIRREISSRIILEIARGTITWRRDPDWGYETAAAVPGIADWMQDYNPAAYYDSAAFQRLTQELMAERKAYLMSLGYTL